LGYHCCSSVNPKVVKEDEYGKWGEEDGQLCGIDNTSTSDCPVDDYPCCSPEITEVAYTDEKGTWGIENDGWC
ncbi:hypothetical protein LY90DRAFT_363480, partial [Neocallimastix californiae]